MSTDEWVKILREAGVTKVPHGERERLQALREAFDNFVRQGDVNLQVIPRVAIEDSDYIVRVMPGGNPSNTKDAFLAAPDITNVWFARSGGNVTGRKDIVWRRFGEKVFSLWDVSSARELFYVTESGRLYPVYGITTVGFDTMLLDNETGVSLGAIGVSYVDVLNKHWTYMDFSNIRCNATRIILLAQGNEAGSKALRVITDTTELGEVVWSGTAIERIKSSWKEQSLEASGDSLVKIQAKASSTSEVITVYNLRIQSQHGVIE